MALLDLEGAKRVRDDLLGQLLRTVTSQNVAAGAVFQTMEAPTRRTVPVAVGLSRKPDDAGYSVAVRVQGNSEAARREGERLRAAAEASGATVDLAEIQEARIPQPGLAGMIAGHPLLTKRADKLCVGLSIGHADGGLGTLGCFVNKGGQPALASCAHVLADSGLIEREVWIHHPGRPDVPTLGGPTRIAKLGQDFVEFSTEGHGTNIIDAALALIAKPENVLGNQLPAGLESPAAGKRLAQGPSYAEAEAFLGKRVGKVGRTTGYTEGTLNAVLEQVRVVNPRFPAPLEFVNVLEVLADDPALPFTQPGDSGSAVFLLDGLRVIGLHFASPGPRSFACPLDVVLQHYNMGWL